MNNLFKKTAHDYSSSAKVVDGNLIISLPDAINPIVWRMELGSVKASALEVRTIAADGTFMLCLKTPKGDVHDIAPFTSRDAAVNALMQVSAALQSAQGKIAPFSSPQNAQTDFAAPASASGSGKWLIALACVVIVIFLFAYLNSYAPTVPDDTGMPSAATTTTGQTNETTGVPESADKLLQGF